MARSRRSPATSIRITTSPIADLDAGAVVGARARSSGWCRELAAGPRRPLGDDLSAPHGAPDHRARALAQAGRAHRRRRLRSEPGAGGVDASRTRRGRDRPRRRRRHVPRAGPRASRAATPLADVAGPLVSRGHGVPAHAAAPMAALEGGRDPPAEPRAPACCPATRCSGVRSTSSKRHAAARSTAASARSSRCAAATSTASRSSASSPTSPMPSARGARAVFLVDDNITLDVARFEALCHAIIDAGLHASTTSSRR